MAELATLSDIQNIANTESEKNQRTLLGITKEPPRYETIPADGVDGKKEFVVDCYILENASQVVVLGSAGLRVIENVLVTADATGDLLADIHVPVDIRRNTTGQLEIVGRAKVALPTLRLDEYSPGDLGIHHVLELEYDETEKVWKDAFGVVSNVNTGTAGTDAVPNVNNQTTLSTALSDLAQLGYDDSGNPVNLGVNPLQRVIVTTTNAFEIEISETANTTEEQVVT